MDKQKKREWGFGGTAGFTKLDAIIQNMKDSIAQMDQHLEPKSKASEEIEAIHNEMTLTGVPQL